MKRVISAAGMSAPPFSANSTGRARVFQIAGRGTEERNARAAQGGRPQRRLKLRRTSAIPITNHLDASVSAMDGVLLRSRLRRNGELKTRSVLAAWPNSAQQISETCCGKSEYVLR